MLFRTINSVKAYLPSMGANCCYEREKDTVGDRRIVRPRNFFPDVTVGQQEELPLGGDEYTDERIAELVSHYNARLAREREDLATHEDSSLIQAMDEIKPKLRLDTSGKDCVLFRVRTWYINNRRKLKIIACVTASGLVISVGLCMILVPWAVVKAIVLGTWLGITIVCTSVKHIIGIGTTVMGGAALYAWLASQYQRLSVSEQEGLGARNGFRNTFDKPPKHWVERRCSHEKAGNERSMVKKILIDMAILHHGEVFVIDGAASDCKQADARPHLYGRSREIYTDKDAHLSRYSARPPPGAAVVMIDSDYHRDDLAEILIHNVCYAYTFTPAIAGGPLGNATLSIGPTADNGYNPDAVTVTVSGGAKYSHPVWDYSCDNFSVGDLFGRTVFLVEHHRISECRSVVMLLPVAWIPHFHWGMDANTNSLFYITKRARELQRCKYNRKGVIHVNTITAEGVEMISLALENTSVSVTIPYRQYRSAHSAYASQRVKDNGFSAIVSTKHKERDDFQADMRMLRDVMNVLGDEILPSMVDVYAPPAHTPMMQRKAFLKDEEVPDGDVGRTTQIAADKNDHEDVNRSGRNVFQPLIPGGAVLDNTRAAREYSVKKKLIDVRAKNDASAEEIARWDYITDRFCELELANYHHKVVPLTLEEVAQEMTKPSQKAMFLNTNEYTFPDVQEGCKGNSFVKKEPAGNPSKCSRLITTPGKKFKTWWACYTLAAAVAFKSLPYWLPGKTPAQIAAQVHAFAKFAADMGVKISCQDSSSHDGHRCMLTIRCFARAMQWLFVVSEMEKLLEFIYAQTDRKCPLVGPKTRSQIIDLLVYWIGSALGSGMNCTTICNTFGQILPPFGVLLEKGIRVHHDWNAAPTWVKIHPKDCGKYLGGHGGDDTCNGACPDESRKNNEVFEHDIRLESYGAPHEPFTLLARTWPNARDSPASHSDIRRVLSKIHYTVTEEDIPKTEVYARKGLALAITDGAVPILGNLSKLLLRSAGLYSTAKVHQQMREGKLNDELSYQARACVFHECGFPQADREHPGLVEHFIKELGGSPTIVDEFCSTLDDCRHISEYVAPQVMEKDWIAPLFSMVGGAIVLKGQGMKDGLPFFTEGDEKITYSMYDLNWGKPPKVLMPDTHRVIQNKDGSQVVAKLGVRLLDAVRSGKTIPYYRLGKMKYREGENSGARHLGQLKLFISFLRFSQLCGGFEGKDLLILGSNPGTYLSMLKELTKLRTIHTYDMKRHKPKGSDRHRFGPPGTVTRENLKGILDEHPGWLVYSDIRTSAGTHPTEEEVEFDNVLSTMLATWTADRHLMIKYRCCFDRPNWPVLPDNIFCQPFAPQASTETRFYYSPGRRIYHIEDTRPVEFDRLLYEQRMAFFNRVVRTYATPEGCWEDTYSRNLMVEHGIPIGKAQELILSGKFADDHPADPTTTPTDTTVDGTVAVETPTATPPSTEPSAPATPTANSAAGSSPNIAGEENRSLVLESKEPVTLNPPDKTQNKAPITTGKPTVANAIGATAYKCKVCKSANGHEKFCRHYRPPKPQAKPVYPKCDECGGQPSSHRAACSYHHGRNAPSSSSKSSKPSA